MRQIADDVASSRWPTRAINAYILGDVLVDAGYKTMGGRAVAAARERCSRATR